MEREAIKKYAGSVPLMVRKMFAALDGDVNWAILEILRQHGDLPVSDIRRITELEEKSLELYMKKLQDSGLVENYFQKKEGIKETSFYELTVLASNLLDDVENSTLIK